MQGWESWNHSSWEWGAERERSVFRASPKQESWHLSGAKQLIFTDWSDHLRIPAFLILLLNQHGEKPSAINHRCWWYVELIILQGFNFAMLELKLVVKINLHSPDWLLCTNFINTTPRSAEGVKPNIARGLSLLTPQMPWWIQTNLMASLWLSSFGKYNIRLYLFTQDQNVYFQSNK